MAKIIGFPGLTRTTSLRRTTVRFIAPQPGRAATAQVPLPLPATSELDLRIAAAKATSANCWEASAQAGKPSLQERWAKLARTWDERTDALIAEKAQIRVQAELLPVDPPADGVAPAAMRS